MGLFGSMFFTNPEDELYNHALNGRASKAYKLLEMGVNPNARNNAGLFPLYVAAEGGHLGIVIDLIEHGANVNQATPNNSTALNNAAEEGHLDVVEYLLSQGADPTIKTVNGHGPEDGARHYGHYKVAEVIASYTPSRKSQHQHVEAMNGRVNFASEEEVASSFIRNADSEDVSFPYVTAFDENFNRNLYYLAKPDTLKLRKARPSCLYMTNLANKLTGWNDYSEFSLNDFIANVESCDEYYDLVFNTVSPAPFFTENPNSPKSFTIQDMIETINKSRLFFNELNGQDEPTNVDNYKKQGASVITLSRLFNPATLSLLSIPAFMSFALKSCATIDPKNHLLFATYCMYDLNNIEEYSEALLAGRFSQINCDAFLLTYGLASCLNLLSIQVSQAAKRFGFKDISDISPSSSLQSLWRYLVEKDALKNPFPDGPIMWQSCDTGIQNANEANPNLAAALLLTEELPPFPLYDSEPGATLSIFYGLVDYFQMRDCFGIDESVVFKFPARNSAMEKWGL